MIEFTFLIPLVRDSDKQPHHDASWAKLEQSLCSLYGGYTTPGIVRGSWSDSQGRLTTEGSREFRVAVPDDCVNEFYNLMRDYRVVFDQQCLYVAQTSLDARLI